MSVLVEEGGEFNLYTKGADSNMITQMDWESRKSEKELLEKHLYTFACDGLRTLVMGKRKVSEKEKTEILNEMYEIQTSSENKNQLYSELYEQYEIGLEYVGASAIEDKLQDKVPETIEKLMEANIRLWVLTGDKQETAIEIAKS